MICRVCGKPLNKSQYSQGENYKSCPRCSEINGEEHVFFRYPEDFGQSDKRETLNHPDGPQSYCYVHRPNPDRVIPRGGLLCSEINQNN